MIAEIALGFLWRRSGPICEDCEERMVTLDRQGERQGGGGEDRRSRGRSRRVRRRKKRALRESGELQKAIFCEEQLIEQLGEIEGCLAQFLTRQLISRASYLRTAHSMGSSSQDESPPRTIRPIDDSSWAPHHIPYSRAGKRKGPGWGGVPTGPEPKCLRRGRGYEGSRSASGGRGPDWLEGMSRAKASATL